MNRVKKSLIWKVSKDELEAIVKSSKTLSEVLKHFGLSHKGGNSKILKERCSKEQISIEHIKLGHDSNRGKHFKTGAPLSEICVDNSLYTNRGTLKRRLIKAGLLQNKCYICGMEPVWNNMVLTFILDHINGKNNDHRLENLRLLCPNCNSQTDTFAGRNFHK